MIRESVDPDVVWTFEGEQHLKATVLPEATFLGARKAGVVYALILCFMRAFDYLCDSDFVDVVCPFENLSDGFYLVSVLSNDPALVLP